MFSSEEYQRISLGSLTRVFGFFLTAPGSSPVNMALVSGHESSVSINNVNDGNTDADPTSPTNQQFYVNNQV